MVLENIEAGSLTVWLRNILQRADDEALRTLDWKPLVGRYLVRAKYVYLNWTNRPVRGSLLDLARELRALASETDIKQLPDYAPPSVRELAESARSIENAKAYLTSGDKISYVVPGEPPADFDLAVKLDDEALQREITKETAKTTGAPMTLIVKKPDYLGQSKWDFRFGTRAISASVGDERWLRDFQTRKIDVRPGDALKCLVDIEHHYGFDNELISETYSITKVTQVLENVAYQSELPLDGNARQ